MEEVQNEPLKPCSKCKIPQPISEYDPNIYVVGGYSHSCKTCRRSYHKGKAREYRQKDGWLEKHRDGHLRRTYGITGDDYNKMLKDQKGVCAICHKPETKVMRGKVAHLSVDHCHITGKVRALLCSHCNVLAARGRDNPEILRLGAEYLERHARIQSDSSSHCDG